MSHAAGATIDIHEAIEAEPIKLGGTIGVAMWTLVGVGILMFVAGLFWYPHDLLWGAYYTNLVFWMGLACGGVMVTAIMQIVRATWSPPVRRIAEANVAFLPYAYVLFLGTWFGREYLFTWARTPMPGREWWMSPGFVYSRFAILFLVLFFLMFRYVWLSIRGDLGLLREKASKPGRWHGGFYDNLTEGWKGSAVEVPVLQNKMSRFAPFLVFVYVTIYSLFAFEMIMGMNPIWYSNLFGAFNFVGNLYMGWASLAILVFFLASRSTAYAKVVSTSQTWDLGKLCFGFCMLWGYMFFSQFLPHWYGNLPEETQWMILRTREEPWKTLGWVTFTMAFIFPFITLLSDDLKKTPLAFTVVALVALCGVWLEKYMVIMPEISPHRIPLSIVEVGIFLGFFGGYVLAIRGFLSRYPFLPVSHPATRGSVDW
jgi:hypothetical protein